MQLFFPNRGEGSSPSDSASLILPHGKEGYGVWPHQGFLMERMPHHHLLPAFLQRPPKLILLPSSDIFHIKVE